MIGFTILCIVGLLIWLLIRYVPKLDIATDINTGYKYLILWYYFYKSHSSNLPLERKFYIIAKFKI